jgi:hypothetical protein
MVHQFEFQNIERRFTFRGLLSLIFLILIFLSQSGESGAWSINGGVQYLNGKYIYTTSTSTYYVSGGIRYESSHWNVGVSVPAIAQNNDLVSSSASMFLPSGHHEGNNEGGLGDGHQGGGMMGGGRVVTDNVQSHFVFGLGDIYLSGQYQLVGKGRSGPPQRGVPSIAVSAQIKFPTASKERNYGTGEFDYGTTLNLAKRWKNYAGFLDAGFWLLGDTPEVNYENPFTYAIGVGRFFKNGRFSVLLYYQGYSTILENYDPPRQGSLGFYYRMSDQAIFSATAIAGFSDTSPDFGLSAGFNLTL